MPAGLLLRCALPIRPLPPPPRPGGGHRGATWPNRAGPGGSRLSAAGPHRPGPGGARRSQAAVPEPMVRAERERRGPADRTAPSQPHPSSGDAWVTRRG